MRIPRIKRQYTPWWTWECYKAGFYRGSADPLSHEEAKEAYRDFLASLERFDAGINRVFSEWPSSCVNFLTNEEINRVAWIGQSAMCVETSVPSKYRGGFWLLDKRQQEAANKLAEQRLVRWIYEQKAKDCTVRPRMVQQMLFA